MCRKYLGNADTCNIIRRPFSKENDIKVGTVILGVAFGAVGRSRVCEPEANQRFHFENSICEDTRRIHADLGAVSHYLVNQASLR